MQKFAVFDIDGTLIRWQLYHAVVDRLAKKGLLGEDAKGQLDQARMHWKRREHPDAFHYYERALIGVYSQALPLLSTEQFDTAVGEIIQEYKAQVYTYTRDLITELKQQEYMLIAISGSHQELVEQIAKEYGFDIWQGSTYERHEGKFTGEAAIASTDKKARLQQIITDNKLSLDGSYAVGDSQSDAPMLEMVENPIAFNPDQKLYDLAKEQGWNIVVERKNVIYELEAQDGKYLLA
ncbi:HAD family phosphatase [Candidatus Saccharibacteria bacterium]|nr:HAD family phosphatase [Candidatus Saccharibacteria bacterium]